MPILLNALALAAYVAVAALLTKRAGGSWALGLGAFAWAAHGLSFLAVLLSDTPRFGWSLSLSITAWVLVGIYAIESRVLKVSAPIHVWLIAAAGCALVLLVPPARAVPAGQSIWYTSHWVLGLAAYALFAAAVLHGLWLAKSERALQSKLPMPEERASLSLLAIEKLMMRLVWAGFLVLSLSLLFGLVLGEQRLGQVIKWDHKTVFSVLSWLVFAGLLAAHHFTGLRGRKAVNWVLIGALLLLLGYAGSRFVLEVLLKRAL
jgi:ABC-type uncharacterized transport system permease subunit